MRLIDTHTHLNDPSLYQDRKVLVGKALSNGVEKMIIIGYDLESSKLAVKIAEEFEGICYAAIGVHPCECLKTPKNYLEQLEKLSKSKYVVAIGEIGYDFYWKDVDEKTQTKFFLQQIKLADKLNLPIILHVRDAISKTLDFLRENKQYINHSGIMHCYCGSKEMAKDFIDLGMYISFGGPLTFKNGRVAKEAITAVPLDKLLFETDAPYLAPHPLRGTRNEPNNVVLVAKTAAEILNKTEEEISSIEFENAERFLSICKR